MTISLEPICMSSYGISLYFINFVIIIVELKDMWQECSITVVTSRVAVIGCHFFEPCKVTVLEYFLLLTHSTQAPL